MASGRPAPRKAPVGAVFVSTDRVDQRTLTMPYTPTDIRRVMNGNMAPIAG